MDAIEQFAAETVVFAHWARHGADTGAPAAREALVRITRLYLLGLQLPSYWTEDTADRPDAVDLGDDEWQAVFTATGRLPVDEYAEIFDPLTLPPEPPVVGSLADDIADIYQDVVTGLRAYQAGQKATALWEWGFGFQSHWGAHATDAMRALHWWMTTHGHAFAADA